MATLDLSNQANNAGQIESKIQTLKGLMDLRKPIWDRLSYQKRKQWVLSGQDPIMTLAWQTFKYLRNNFFGDTYGDSDV
jgi:hypothetical protein